MWTHCLPFYLTSLYFYYRFDIPNLWIDIPKATSDICDPTQANEALCGKINFELWAKM